MPAHRAITAVACLASCLFAPLARGEELSLPHRHGARILDGILDDWGGPALVVAWAEPEAPTAAANRATARAAWDPSYLWLAIEMEDSAVHVAPPEITDLRLYQWDSVEVYLDTQGNRGPRLDTGDFQFILAADGRHAVLQGDALADAIDELGTPKRERPSLALRVATRIGGGGYQIEAAIPWAAVGLAEAAPGMRIGLDLAFNDWDVDHPILAEIDLNDPATLALIDEEEEHQISIIDPADMGWDAREEWLEREYRPWSWSGTRDFGYPDEWKALVLAGKPSLTEGLLRRFGGWKVALALCSVTALLAAVLLAHARRGQRRRIEGLQRRLAALERGSTEPPPLSAGPPAGPPTVRPTGGAPLLGPPSAASLPRLRARLDPGEGDDGAVSSTDSLATRIVWALEGRSVDEDTPEGLARRALEHVHTHLDQTIPVAGLARAVFVSPRTLQRGLKEALGCSPREFILAVKMQEARQLLEGGTLRVSEVAYRVGFENPDHFSRRFKSYYRVPPSAMLPSRERSPARHP